MSNKSVRSELQQPLTENIYVTVESPQVTSRYYVVDSPQRKRLAGCGACLCVLSIFALLFFLIPRTPQVWLSGFNAASASSDLFTGFVNIVMIFR